MKHPPYHLRVNKAIDRFLLIDLLWVLQRRCDLSNYTYYGLGGPFLEDCRLINQFFPRMRICSIEEDEQTYLRQEYHKFTRNLYLEHKDLEDFLFEFSGEDREIFWLDFPNMKYKLFCEFSDVLTKVGEYSIIKMTVNAELRSYRINSSPKRRTCMDKFREEYGNVLPTSFDESCFSNSSDYVRLIQDMVRIQTDRALPAHARGNIFQLLNSSYYSDGTTMLSVTGIVVPIDKVSDIRQLFENWEFANLDWNTPLNIDIPILSIKERLKLERLLPSLDSECSDLSDALGYQIDPGRAAHKNMLSQYRDFHRFYPTFAKIVV